MNAPRDPGWAATWRELGQLGWAIVLIDLIALGLGALAARSMGAFAHWVGVGLALFVTLCFAVLVGGNLLVAWIVWWWRKRRRRILYETPPPAAGVVARRHNRSRGV